MLWPCTRVGGVRRLGFDGLASFRPDQHISKGCLVVAGQSAGLAIEQFSGEHQQISCIAIFEFQLRFTDGLKTLVTEDMARIDG